MKQDTSIKTITDNNTKYSAISLNIRGDIYAVKNVTLFNKDYGWEIKNGKTEPFYCYGFLTVNKINVLAFPYVTGILLKDILNFTLKNAIPYLIKLAKALQVYKQLAGVYKDIQLDSVIFTNYDSIIILSPDIMKNIRDFSTIEYVIENYMLINNFYNKENESGLTYVMGAIIYRIITNIFPYKCKNEEELFIKLRNSKIIPPHIIVPGLDHSISKTIMYSLEQNKQAKNPFLLDNWVKKLENWQKITIFKELTPLEQEKCKIEKEKTLKKIRKNYKRSLCFEKNKNKISVLSILSIVCIVISLIVININKQPRLTKGFSPEKIISSYYNGINRFDHALMKDCVINNAGKDDINMVIGLFLASRQITSNGGERNILAANVWDRKGRKKTDKLIYGVIDLKLSLLYKDINQIYHAEYEKWIPELVKNSNTFKFYTSKGYYIKEKVFLKKNNNNWLIYKFEKLEQVSVEKKRVSE